MGLSSKQVISSDGLDWSQSTLLQAQTLELPKPPPVIRRQQQQNQNQSEPLKCPRCDSTNTKFCYYNNYNKSQPRHFCKTCKRHWTKGGTLRNVPVGGGRKNKRLKTSKTATATATATKMALQARQQNKQNNLSLAAGNNQKNMPEIMYQALNSPQTSASDMHQNSVLDGKSSFNSTHSNNKNVFLDSSAFALPQSQGLLQFPFSSFSTFDTNPSSISTSFQSSNLFTGESAAMEDSIINTILPVSQLWQQQVPSTSGGMDMSASYWNWDDIDNLVSTDLNIQWDDSDIKPSLN